tara:strand:+ start:343 stop:546 length:204 start_codon:yes stop_codon:yes gene_type:complete
MEERAGLSSQDFIDKKAIADMLSVKPKAMDYLIQKDKTFPKPLVLSPRMRRWKREEIVDWINSKLGD